MEKPKRVKKELYDIISLADYLDEKHQLNLDHRDVWHWFVLGYEPNNGSIINFSTQIQPNEPEWVKVFLTHAKAEFGDNIELLVQW